jgi:hypothetical protein
MNKGKQELLDEAYENFVKSVENNRPAGYVRKVITKSDFMKESNFNKDFREYWGLKIEERELKKNSGWERYELLLKGISEKELQEKYKDDERATWLGFRKFTLVNANYICDKENIPTKLITITYNDKTIESYE